MSIGYISDASIFWNKVQKVNKANRRMNNTRNRGRKDPLKKKDQSFTATRLFVSSVGFLFTFPKDMILGSW